MNIHYLNFLVSSVLLVSVGLYVYVRFMPFLWDCRITEFGVEVVVFRFIKVWKIRFRTIEAAEVISGWRLYDPFRLNPYRTVRIPSRIFGEKVLLTKTGIISHLVITPKDPRSFCAIVNSSVARI
jgi:hypothetical protein